MKQTAVEWLVDELQKAEYIPKDSIIMNYVTKQAKEMEKEQIIDFVDNLIVGMSREKIEQYYNETFKNSEQ